MASLIFYCAWTLQNPGPILPADLFSWDFHHIFTDQTHSGVRSESKLLECSGTSASFESCASLDVLLIIFCMQLLTKDIIPNTCWQTWKPGAQFCQFSSLRSMCVKAAESGPTYIKQYALVTIVLYSNLHIGEVIIHSVIHQWELWNNSLKEMMETPLLWKFKVTC